jgi:hypothetical protein
MNAVEQTLGNWKDSLPATIDQGGLCARNPTAHKWKALFRSLALREGVFWRLHDLLTQSYALHRQGHALGARILLRSGFETVATIIYLNQLTANVLVGALNFHTFSDNTATLLLGSRNKTTEHESINILTVLKKCDKRYPGLLALYADLSESAHPSYEGTCIGYSRVDHDAYAITFSNRWVAMYGDKHLSSMVLCMANFEHEYSEVWPQLYAKLEKWVEVNDAELESTKPV